MQPQSDTERLLLELISEQDHEFMLELLNTEGWLRFIGDRNVHSKEDSVAYINRIQTTPDLFYWVVKLKDAKTPIGIISFLKRNYLEHFDIGFAFLPKFTGLGYAYEAASKIMALVSNKAEYQPILATTLPHNSNSVKLLVKLGFRLEKEMELQNEKLHIYSNVPAISIA